MFSTRSDIRSLGGKIVFAFTAILKAFDRILMNKDEANAFTVKHLL